MWLKSLYFYKYTPGVLCGSFDFSLLIFRFRIMVAWLPSETRWYYLQRWLKRDAARAVTITSPPPPKYKYKTSPLHVTDAEEFALHAVLWHSVEQSSCFYGQEVWTFRSPVLWNHLHRLFTAMTRWDPSDPSYRYPVLLARYVVQRPKSCAEAFFTPGTVWRCSRNGKCLAYCTTVFILKNLCLKCCTCDTWNKNYEE